MSRARQCDRCGNFYKENDAISIDGKYVTGIEVVHDTCILRVIDLCDKCVLELHDFMKGDNK